MNDRANSSRRFAFSSPVGVGWWVILCATLNCAGWILSALHQLNSGGYAVTILFLALVLFIWQKKLANTANSRASFRQKLFRRLHRPFPLAFAILALLAFLGGAIYAPNNYDALSYRLPRILHWLSAGQWHWIHTTFERLNARACGYEWVAAPIISLTRSDRLLFLIDVVSFLLLPGLVFSVMRRVGVSARAAWYWMWLLPTGYCYLLQAGSIGNDMFSAVFALAALDFALRARTSKSAVHLWLSLLAVALVTGGKTSNLPLLLPWGLAVLPSLKYLLPHIPATLGVGMVAAVASFLPMGVLNYRHCGDWTGQAAEQVSGLKGSPVLYVSQNIALLTIQNLVPPVFPWASRWNATVLKVIPPNLRAKQEASFEPAGAHLAVGEMQIEEEAALGFGVTVLLLLTFAATVFVKGGGAIRHPQLDWFQITILAGSVVCIGPYLIAAGLTTAGRIVTPYYALIVPVFLLWQSGSWIARNRWWKCAGMIVFFLGGMLVVISPSRPLWPAQTLLGKTGEDRHGLVGRAASVYGVYRGRARGFAPARAALPTGLKVLGLISRDAPETSLWLPFGSRRVEHVIATDDPGYLQRHDIEYVLINPHDFALPFTESIADWCARQHAEIVQKIPMTLRASSGSVDWILVKVRQ